MRLRSRLRKLVVLELVLRSIGVGTLLAISVRAVIVSPDLPTAEWTGALVIAAVAYLALAFRTRAGAESVRRDIHWKEAREEMQREETGLAHPYRSQPHRSAHLPSALQKSVVHSHDF